MTPKELTLEEKLTIAEDNAQNFPCPSPYYDGKSAGIEIGFRLAKEIFRAHEAERKAKMPTEGQAEVAVSEFADATTAFRKKSNKMAFPIKEWERLHEANARLWAMIETCEDTEQ